MTEEETRNEQGFAVSIIMALAQWEENNWQTTRESVRERNKFMFNYSLLSDVKFVMRNTSKDEAKEKYTKASDHPRSQIRPGDQQSCVLCYVI